ncbi:hypothetical protein [Arthrobacter sp. KBS0703]|uniref:hypothetical protein n=1 Tax=Arthrobacter sp. KBS0703 TaxID=1955698 RepID=UPI0021B113B0|nr:hypothetical protein [Arthrobacter sp. KBS0703]
MVLPPPPPIWIVACQDHSTAGRVLKSREAATRLSGPELPGNFPEYAARRPGQDTAGRPPRDLSLIHI